MIVRKVQVALNSQLEALIQVDSLFRSLSRVDAVTFKGDVRGLKILGVFVDKREQVLTMSQAQSGGVDARMLNGVLFDYISSDAPLVLRLRNSTNAQLRFTVEVTLLEARAKVFARAHSDAVVKRRRGRAHAKSQ